MTRRKQNAPKRLKSTDKAGSKSVKHQPVNSSHVNSDSGTGDGDEEEGDTASDEENTVDKQVDATKRDQDPLNCQIAGKPGHDSLDSQSADSSNSSRIHFLGETSSQKCCHSTKTEDWHGDREIRASTSPSTEAIVTSNSSHVEERGFPWSSQPTTTNSGLGSGKCKYSCKLSPPAISSSPALALTSLDSQMALVMSSLPLGLLSRVTTSSSPQEPALTYVSVPILGQLDDQPLDLSKKPETMPLVVSKDKDSKHFSSSESTFTSSSSSTSNGFSSLQSLQQRFGGHYPLGLSQKVSSSVIPLQSSVNHKTAVAQHALSTDAHLRSAMGKSKLGPRPDWMEKQDVTRASVVSPMLRGGNSRHTSPVLTDESATEAGGKHTIHRCSCQKSFNTLYSLSLHLQETGHTPASSKTASLMDYPKLVRGQDMWLNQESEQTRRILRCMQCGESFKSLPLLTVHMMQTQHYTKIVSSDHGRRSHKCSTYCDRELDKECIFKCKVCHEAFTDMEGLANHMIASGHHKKQSSRQISNPSDFSGDISSLARQGRRKRFPRDDITQSAVSGISSSTVASLLEHRQKQAVSSHSGMNGFHCESRNNTTRSPEVQSLRLVQCDSCGKNVESREFDSHIRACLKHRAEVIDALKSKLAVEEALLSRSENKLLRSGFRLSSVSGHQENIFTNAISRGRESLSSEDHERNLEDSSTDNQSLVKSERTSPVGSAAVPEHKHLPKLNETNAQICDLVDVPLKKWYCSNDEPRQAATSEDNGGFSNSKLNTKVSHQQTVSVNYTARQNIKQEDIDQDVLQDSKSTLSPGVGVKRKLSEVDLGSNGFNNMRKKDRLSPDLVQESKAEESLDFTSSALHKLDMFSRGLKFSPPRRNSSPESKLPTHPSARTSKKKELASSIAKSAIPVSASPLSHLKMDSPDASNKNMTFDIIDPNADSGETVACSSALEAMESFIHKSFSAKSDLRTSNLASMFSPFRNCFPLPGSLPGQSGVLPDSSDQTFSHFAKFSKFFRMVPGVPPFPETTSVHSQDIKKMEGAQTYFSPSPLSEPRLAMSHDKTAFLSQKAPTKPQSSTSTIKVPVVKFTPDHPPGHSSNHAYKLSGEKKADIISSSRKYKYCTSRSLDALTSSKNHGLQQQGSSQLSGKIDAKTRALDSSRVDNSLPSPSDLETSVEEPKRKRPCELNLRLEDTDSKLRNTQKCDDNTDTDVDNKVKKEASSSPEGHRCEDDSDCSVFCSQEHKMKNSSLMELPSETCQQGIHSKSVTDMPGDEVGNKQVSGCIEHAGPCPPGEHILKSQPSVKLEVNDEATQVMQTEDAVNGDEDSNSDKDDDGDVADTDGESQHEHNNPIRTDRLKNNLNVQAKNTDKPVKQSTCIDQLRLMNGWLEKTSLESAESNSHFCDGDVDTDDDDDLTSSLALRKTKERTKVQPGETRSNIQNVGDMTAVKGRKISGNQNVLSAVKGIEGRSDINNSWSDSENNHCSVGCVDEEKSIPITCSVASSRDVDDDVVGDGDKTSAIVSKLQLKQGLESHFTGTRSYKRPSKSPDGSTRSVSDKMHPLGASSFDISDKIPIPQDGMSRIGSSEVPEGNVILKHRSTRDIENVGTQKKKKKRSALDSLSSFVYSQPLTSEHPLDSLHKLLSTNELSHLTADPHRCSAATSNKCLTPDISIPINLTSKGGGIISSGGCSSDDNDDGDAAATEGGASEGDLREYKCAACNRKFASKGSYRYHLSRCHLSSVKKYGIKEAFNMSPYVYLPLDHTAKFSKYYQLAHELANKGK